MKDIIVAALVLLNSGFVLLLCGLWFRREWKRQGRIEAGAWIGPILFGGPALVAFVMTLLGFK